MYNITLFAAIARHYVKLTANCKIVLYYIIPVTANCIKLNGKGESVIVQFGRISCIVQFGRISCIVQFGRNCYITSADALS